jgi:endonuclease/exonuclease/phosphatase family metal-dependent hydrolase
VSQVRFRVPAVALTIAILSPACARLPLMTPTAAHTLADCRAVPPATSIQWIGPEATRDRVRLDAWCATVGPPVIDSTSVSRAPSVDRLVIITWNTHVGAGDVVRLAARLRSGVFTSGTPVQHFVLLLQEAVRRGSAIPEIAPRIALPSAIGRGSEAMPVDEIARTLELNLLYVPAMRNGSGREDRGNAILSTLPFDRPTVIELPFERQRRLALAARVHGRSSSGTEWRLRVATMHLDTSPALWRGGPAQARLRQTRALVSALSEPDERTIVAGDLNTWWGDDEPAVKELRQAFPDAGTLADRETTWHGPLGAATRVDYVFARTNGETLQVWRLPDRFGSDHHPLMTLVTVK